MTTLKRTGHWGTTALVSLAFGFSACDEAVTDLADDTVGQEAVVADVGGLLAGVTEDLLLTSSQTAAVDDLAVSFGARMGEPGAFWRLAGELHSTLTAEQIAQIVDRQADLLEQMAARDGDGPPAFGRRHGGHGGGFGRHPRNGATRLLPDATGEQRQAIREVLESLRPQFKALHEQLRNGQITPEEFRAQARELRQAAHAEIEPLLTDEQRAALDEHRARRKAFIEETKAVRIEVLGLTDAQVAELEALKEQWMSTPRGDTSIAERIGAHREAAAAILSDTQMEIGSLYHGLRAGAGRGRAGHGPGAPFGAFHGA